MPTEPQLQAVVRRVLAAVIREASRPDDETDAIPHYERIPLNWCAADRLDAAEPSLLALLQPMIEEANDAWSKEHRLVAIRDAEFYWTLKPEVTAEESTGMPLVVLRWGWDGERSVTMEAGNAFDLALDILNEFSDEEGEPKRPPAPPEAPMPEALSRRFEEFHEVAREVMTRLGDGSSCSLTEANAWVTAGRPDTITPHDYKEYPEDHVAICLTCGFFYYTDRDCRDKVCSGQPLPATDHNSVHYFDPRRGPELREAQRLDHIVSVLKRCETMRQELAPWEERLAKAVMELDSEDLERYRSDAFAQRTR